MGRVSQTKVKIHDPPKPALQEILKGTLKCKRETKSERGQERMGGILSNQGNEGCINPDSLNIISKNNPHRKA